MRRQKRQTDVEADLYEKSIIDEEKEKEDKNPRCGRKQVNYFLGRCRVYYVRFMVLKIVLLLFWTLFISVLYHEPWMTKDSSSPQRTFSRQGDSNAAAITVFYHVYIPPDKGKKGIQQASDIIQEQLSQINDYSDSHAITIYYTTNGVEQVAQREAERICREKGMNCHLMGHWTDGHEDVTLTRLYRYCQTNLPSTVVYLHTKGSYHSNKGKNHAWRWHLTKAALTCASSMKSSMCNVCGLQFYPVWTTFFPGNMWAASCAYVNDLWAPGDFATQLENTVEKARRENDFQWSLYNASNPGNLGLGRYAMEHWIASHPAVRPCEITNDSPSLEQWYDKNTTQSTTLVLAPQHDWMDVRWFRWNVSLVKSTLLLSNSRKEYFLLPGYLHKWRSLYNQLPPGDSWAWKWFPDGSSWKDAVRLG